MLEVEDNLREKKKPIQNSLLKDIKTKITSLVLNQLKKLLLDEPKEEEQTILNPLTPLRQLKTRNKKQKPVVHFSSRLSAKLALKTQKKQSLRRLALLKQKSQKLIRSKKK
jgi:hypothetical protein